MLFSGGVSDEIKCKESARFKKKAYAFRGGLVSKFKRDFGSSSIYSAIKGSPAVYASRHGCEERSTAAWLRSGFPIVIQKRKQERTM